LQKSVDGYEALTKKRHRPCALFPKVGGYEMILLLVLKAAVLPAAHPEKE
jgi:hypothetical protein